MAGPQETGRTLMLPIKNNLSARRNNGLAYRVASFNFVNGITAPYVAWEHEPVTVSEDAALAIAMGPAGTSSSDSSALAEAIAFIEKEFLAAERVEASDLAASARNAGISPETLKRARKKLGIVARRDGFGPGSKFYLSLSRSRSIAGQE